MNTLKKPGQVGHIEGRFVAIAAVDFAQCSRILTGEILAYNSSGSAIKSRVVVIGGKVDIQTVIVGKQQDGEDLHVPLLSAIYVDFESAADAYISRAEEVYSYAADAEKRAEVARSKTLRAAGAKLITTANKLRERASVAA